MCLDLLPTVTKRNTGRVNPKHLRAGGFTPFVVQLSPGVRKRVEAAIYVDPSSSGAADIHPKRPVAIDLCRRRKRHAAVEDVVDHSLVELAELVVDIPVQKRAWSKEFA